MWPVTEPMIAPIPPVPSAPALVRNGDPAGASMAASPAKRMGGTLEAADGCPGKKMCKLSLPADLGTDANPGGADADSEQTIEFNLKSLTLSRSCFQVATSF